MIDTIKQIKAGNKTEFREIIRQFSPSIRAYLAGRLNDFHAIEDLLQEIFVAVYHSLDNYNEDYPFKSWLFSIARNKLMSHLRRNYSYNNLKAELEEEIQTVLSRHSEPIIGETTELLVKLKQCIEKLPENARQIIQSRYFTAETVISIAQRTNSSENAVSSKLFRLRKKLKNCIEKRG